MTGEDLCALVGALLRDRRRFTLEDAERQGDGSWVAYLYDARPVLTYRVDDYLAFQALRDDEDLPDAWIASPTSDRARDYGEGEACITLAELGRILEHDRGRDAANDAGGRGRLRALHARYADDGDDCYRVVVRAPAGEDHALTTLDAYLTMVR